MWLEWITITLEVVIYGKGKSEQLVITNTNIYRKKKL